MTGLTEDEPSLVPTADAAWVLNERCYDPLRESSRESRFALSNGFLGVRSSRAINRAPRSIVPPRTYVAGLFDSPGPDQPVPGLIPVADWLQVALRVRASPHEGYVPIDVTGHRRSLDLRRGSLLTEGWLSGPGGASIHLRMLRLVSLSDRSLGLQVIRLEVDGGDFDMMLEASSGDMDPCLIPEELQPRLGMWRTRTSGKRLGMAVAATLELDGADLAPTPRPPFGWCWSWKAAAGQVAYFERMVTFTRDDHPPKEIDGKVAGELVAARRCGWRGAVMRHDAAWADRWAASDVEVRGDEDAQKALRFAIYHLNGAADPDDDRVSIGARGLTGDDYRGHVFWDTEIFLLPFYTLTWPEAARALLTYRFRTLDAARAKASRMGWRGALYAWESTDTGYDETPDQAVGPDRKIVQILCGRQEQHISADVAYAVWQYWLATGDEDFLRDAGAEILLETARFWTSRAGAEADGRCHIRGVIGPDEYHEGIDDNAFTNVMARWNIRRGLETAALLRERWPDRWSALASELDLKDAELHWWRRTADTMATGLDPTTGIYEQFAGFSSLEAVDLADYAGRSVPMDVVLGRERTQRSRLVKQADVVALMMLLPDEFPGASAAANFDRYAPLCSHGSSLSRAMHAVVAARLGRSTAALAFFGETAAIDLGDAHVAIDGGVHVAALGGLWMTAVLGFAGLSLEADALGIAPRLPDGWDRLAFSVRWRGRSLKIVVSSLERIIEATLISGTGMTLAVGGERFEMRLGERRLLGFEALPGA